MIVTNAYGTNTDSVTFTAVAGLPVIATAPLPATRFVGFPFDFSVVAIGSPPLTYISWQLDGTVVSVGRRLKLQRHRRADQRRPLFGHRQQRDWHQLSAQRVALTVNPIPAALCRQQ